SSAHADTVPRPPTAFRWPSAYRPARGVPLDLPARPQPLSHTPQRLLPDQNSAAGPSLASCKVPLHRVPIPQLFPQVPPPFGRSLNLNKNSTALEAVRHYSPPAVPACPRPPGHHSHIRGTVNLRGS